jgi:plasmid stability protein
MVRTQIQLDEEQKQKLKQVAAEHGVSVAELIRQGVDAILATYGRPERRDMLQRAAAAAGRFRSKGKNVAKNHDRYLDQAFSE